MDIARLKRNIVVDSNGCWVWQKSCTSAGYGQLTENGVYWTTHRYAVACTTTLSDDEVVRHICHNPKCCNPAHLLKGTQKDNWLDSQLKYQEAFYRQSHKWIVNGVVYTGLREAVQETEIAVSTIIKYTDTVTRVFDVESYRRSCKIAGWVPKI